MVISGNLLRAEAAPGDSCVGPATPPVSSAEETTTTDPLEGIIGDLPIGETTTTTEEPATTTTAPAETTTTEPIVELPTTTTTEAAPTTTSTSEPPTTTTTEAPTTTSTTEGPLPTIPALEDTTTTTEAPTTTTTSAPPTTTSTTLLPLPTTTSSSSSTSSSTTTTSTPPAHITGALVTGARAPGGPHVRVFDASDHSLKREFFAFTDTFRGGVNVALGDVDNDGWNDIIAGAGPGGGPHVKVFSGKTGEELASFFAFGNSFSGGVNVAACDVNDDGKADIVAGAGPGGGPHVKVFSGAVATGANPANAVLASFFAYGTDFAGGVRVAAADTDGDGKAEVITAAGPGGAPHVRVLKLTANPAAPAQLAGWYAYATNFTGGVFVGANVNDGVSRIVTGAGPGGGQHVRVWRPNGSEIAGVIPTGSTAGATVAIGNGDSDAADEYEVGNATGSPSVRLVDLPQNQQGDVFSAYPGFAGGVSVALGDI